MTALDDELHHALSPELGPDFNLVRPRRWVSSTTAPIRRIFHFYPLKGFRYTAHWGFSLDFVPQLRNHRLRWKRTSKTADFDLCIDPIDEAGGIPGWCSFAFGAPETVPSRSAVAEVAAATSKKAREDFAGVSSIGDVVALFEERSKMRFRRFSLDNYVQTDVAWGLALIAAGRAEEGDSHINAYCDHFRVARNDPLLQEAERAAAECLTQAGGVRGTESLGGVRHRPSS